MHPSYLPPPTPPKPPRPNKATLQKEYRGKEGECITMLRAIIRNLTGEELRTRQEILRKAIEILKTAPELKGGSTVRGGTSGLTASGSLSSETGNLPGPGMASMTSTQTVFPTQLPSNYSGWPQNEMFNTEHDGPILYHGGAYAQDPQYQSLDTIAALLEQAGLEAEGYGEDLSNYPQY